MYVGWVGKRVSACVGGLTCVENVMDTSLLKSGVMQEEFPSFIVSDHHYVYWAWCRSEKNDVGVIVELCIDWHKFKLVGLEVRQCGHDGVGEYRIECVLQGKPSHAGSINTAKNGLVVVVEHARTYMNVLRTSCGSNMGKARHEPVHMYICVYVEMRAKCDIFF